MDQKYFIIALLISCIFIGLKIMYTKLIQREKLQLKHILFETFFVLLSSFIGMFILFENYASFLFPKEHTSSPLVFTDDPYL